MFSRNPFLLKTEISNAAIFKAIVVTDVDIPAFLI
jgi:hypothetical protein